MRFAFGGIHIECSTYSRIRTRMDEFRVFTGERLAAAPEFSFLRSYPHQFLPTLYARAVPGGAVERSAYDTFKNQFIQSLKQLLPLDGLYLPMHGALLRGRYAGRRGRLDLERTRGRGQRMPDQRKL